MATAKPHTTDDIIGYHRANRVGLLLILMTLCQYIVPTVVLHFLAVGGVDVTADALGMAPHAYMLWYLLMYMLMLGIPLLAGKLWLLPKNTHRVSPLNLSSDRKICIVLCGVALCLVANIAAALLGGALFSAGTAEPDITMFAGSHVLALLVNLAVFAIIPAVMEETLLRGIVLQTLRPIGRFAAVCISALLFSLMHGNLAQAPYALLMGLILGTIFVHTDSLRLTIVIHAVANSLSLITTFILQFSDRDLAAFWELLILIVALMMGAVAGIWLLRHPLERSRPKHTATVFARAKGLLRAPFLWAAIVLMVVFMIIYA